MVATNMYRRMMAMSTIIDVRNLTKRYGDLVAVDHVSYEIHEGEIFGLLGPNGSGKTTTILMLVGLINPTEGTAVISGYDVIKQPLEARSSVGLLPENAGYYDNLTARQNLSYYADLARVSRVLARKSIDELLDLVGLSDWKNTKVQAFSRGMRQRLGIAQSLIRDPEILILDEPTQGIDPEGTRDIRELVKELSKERGKTVVLTTHLLHEVDKLCDRVAIMKQGKLIALDTIPNLTNQIKAEEGADFEEVFLRFQGVM
ncbi:MAG: ABC transporter ATP-binding protein [Candidatus Bathyarchaeota archaeon]|nr:ABC transporter ATP-binding protein [Candidatus Bathyarchaeota archaeon]